MNDRRWAWAAFMVVSICGTLVGLFGHGVIYFAILALIILVALLNGE